MNKVIVLIAILVAAFAYVEATRCRSHCSKHAHSATKCVREGSLCRKMKQCAIDEENCRRRQTKRSRLHSTHLALCRNIKGSEGKGRCAIKRRRGPRSVHSRHCQHLNCHHGSKKLNCYSSKTYKCQLLTPCQVELANCRRGRHDLLEWVDLRRCAGMKAGQRPKKCRPGPRRS